MLHVYDESWRRCPLYLATAAFLVLGVFVFCVGCQYGGMPNEETAHADG